MSAVDQETVGPPDGPSDPLDLPLELLVAELVAGRTTSVALVTSALARIAARDRQGPRLNAVLHVAQDALDRARESDLRRDRGVSCGPLDGIPVTVKGCIETADLPTTHGSRLFDGWRAGSDAPVVERLRERGAVLLATTNLDDFAAACFGESSLRGTIANPRAPGRTVSGSSGGSAVSVAAGYVPLSIGTDTGGSLRIPAALCAVTTLRPTLGLVSQAGIFPRSPGQDTAGPMAMSVAGIALGLDAIVDHTGPGHPSAHPDAHAGALPAARSALAPAASEGSLVGLRLGYVRTGLALWGDDPEGPVVAQVDLVVQALRERGAVVVRLDPPDRALLDGTSLITQESRTAVDAYLAARPSAPVRSLREIVASGACSPHAAQAFARELAFVPDPDARLSTHRLRAGLQSWTLDLMDREMVSAILYPTVQQVAVPVGGEQPGVFTRWSEHTGFPALALPVGGYGTVGVPGLRASVEVLGRPWDEVTVLAVGQLIEGLDGSGG